MPRKKDGMYRLTFPDGAQTLPFPYKNGRYHGTFPIHITEDLVDESKNGMSLDCVIANWINDHKHVFPVSLFPKPQKGKSIFSFAYVIKSSVWFITSLLRGDTQPAYAIRLMHNLGKHVDFFDVMPKADFKKAYVGKTLVLQLKTPSRSGGGHDPEEDKKRPPRHGGNQGHATRMTRGALRRARAAGLHYTPLPKKRVYPITELAKRTLDELRK